MKVYVKISKVHVPYANAWARGDPVSLLSFLLVAVYYD
jgi:hypothetical protein